MDSSFVALAIVVGLAELKEYRQSRRMKSLATQMRGLKRSVEHMTKQIKFMDIHFDELHKKINSSDRLLLDASQTANQARDFADKASVALETIVNEYKINGVPLGYNRKEPDFIEGL